MPADRYRLIYTSDHGECLGAHGVFGKSCLYEEAIGVPLIMAGPDIPASKRVPAPVSHVDLYPTLVEAAGGDLAAEDEDLPGRSLFATLEGPREERPIFAEYHATGSKAGSFMLREGGMKLIYHAGMPPQLFDLSRDPGELTDLALEPGSQEVLGHLEAKLRELCDPEDADRRAKRDQESRAAALGGTEEILKAGVFKRSPVPGRAADYRS